MIKIKAPIYVNLYGIELIAFIHLRSILSNGIIAAVFMMIDDQAYGYAS
jgi:hypothetical protein